MYRQVKQLLETLSVVLELSSISSDWMVYTVARANVAQVARLIEEIQNVGLQRNRM